MTVESSPNPGPQVFIIGYANYRKQVFCCFYIKLTSPRKTAKLFVLALIKREIITSHKVLHVQ